MKYRILAALFAVCSAAPASAQIVGYDTTVTFTPTVQNAAYASGNSLGGLQTIPFFRNTTLASGIMDYFSLSSKGGATTAVTVYIFNASPSASTCTDKTAFVLASADVNKLAVNPFVMTPAVVGVGTTVTLGQLVQVASVANHDNPLQPYLYACLVAGGSVTPASTTDLTVTISGALD